MSYDLKDIINLYSYFGITSTGRCSRPILLGFFLVCTLYFAYYKSNAFPLYRTDKYKQILFLTDTISVSSIILINILSVLLPRDDVAELLDMFVRYDRMFGQPPPRIKGFSALLKAAHLVFFLVLVGQIMFLRLSEFALLHYFNIYCQLFYMWSFGMYLVAVLKQIHDRFARLHRAMCSYDRSFELIDDITCCYQLLCDIIKKSNDAYGSLILLRFISDVFSLLLGIVVIIYLTALGNYRSLPLWYISISATNIQLWMVSSYCSCIEKDRRNCLSRACAIKCDAKCLAANVLVHLTSTRSASITAAGLFKADFTLFFTFVNIAATYVVVLLQLPAVNQKLREL